MLVVRFDDGDRANEEIVAAAKPPWQADPRIQSGIATATFVLGVLLTTAWLR